MDERTLVSIVRELVETVGIERADNIIAGAMLIHKDYFSLRSALLETLEET